MILKCLPLGNSKIDFSTKNIRPKFGLMRSEVKAVFRSSSSHNVHPTSKRGESWLKHTLSHTHIHLHAYIHTIYPHSRAPTSLHTHVYLGRYTPYRKSKFSWTIKFETLYAFYYNKIDINLLAGECIPYWVLSHKKALNGNIINQRKLLEAGQEVDVLLIY